MAKKQSRKGEARAHKNDAPQTTEPAALSEAEVEALQSCADETDQYPDVAVRRTINATRLLIASARKLAGPLVARTDLDDDDLDELEKRVSMLERAELAWSDARARRANPELVAARVEGEREKREAMQTLRYFLRHDLETQSRLDEIAEGTGDGDLIDDLRRLGDLLARHRAALARASASLGKNPAERLRALARRIETALVDEHYDVEASDALSLRNRAYWYARELDREVRAAGRFAFRNEPKKLAAFVLDLYPSGGGGDAADDEDEGPAPTPGGPEKDENTAGPASKKPEKKSK